MFDPIDDVPVRRYFIGGPDCPDYHHTDNEQEAWQEFHRSCFQCSLIDNSTGDTLAEKDFVWDVETDALILMETNYTGEDYAELEEVAA